MGRIRNTGSRLLGEWLRRKRAGRTLDEIAKLSKTEPLKDRIRDISVPTLSLIESARCMPNAESIYTLATLYHATTDEIHETINELRLLGSTTLPATDQETFAAYTAAVQSGRWYDAIALALHGERLTGSPRDQVLWRARRGSVLPHVGKAEHGARLLRECWESPSLAVEHQFQVLRNMADAQYMAGNYRSAVLYLRQANTVAPPDASAEMRAGMLATAIALTLARLQAASSVDRVELQETMQLIRETRALLPAGETYWSLLLRLHETAVIELQGNTPVAARDYRALARDAEAAGHARVELLALGCLGALRRKQGKHADAETYLGMAETRAVALKLPNETFEVSFELLLVARAVGDRKKEEHYTRRCERYHLLVTTRSPKVLEFELMTRAAR